MWPASVVGLRRNFLRAGTLKKRCSTWTLVPTGAPARLWPVAVLPSIRSWVANSSSDVRVVKVTWLTAAML